VKEINEQNENVKEIKGSGELTFTRGIFSCSSTFELNYKKGEGLTLEFSELPGRITEVKKEGKIIKIVSGDETHYLDFDINEGCLFGLVHIPLNLVRNKYTIAWGDTIARIDRERPLLLELSTQKYYLRFYNHREVDGYLLPFRIEISGNGNYIRMRFKEQYVSVK
jgi:hypothetical protein